MRKLFLALLAILAVSSTANATTTCAPTNAPRPAARKAAKPQAAPKAQPLASQVPTAKPADVNSIEALLAAVYDVISGPPGERDWNRFRSLFAPNARLTSTTKESAEHPVRLLGVDDYVNLAGDYFKTHGFFESAIVNHVDRFGSMAQVFSSYESRNAANEKPFTRGVNSMQLFYDGSRWYVLSILWDEESPTNPLPANMATRSSSAH